MKYFLPFLLVVCLLWSGGAAQAQVSVSANNDAQVQELEDEIALRQLEIDKLNKKIQVYEQSLANKRAEQVTLSNELDILGEQIERLELEMEANKLQIDTTNLEIQSVLLQILDTEELLDSQRQQLSALLFQMYLQSEKQYVDVLVGHASFSEFFDAVAQTDQVQAGLKRSLDEARSLRVALDDQQVDLDKKSQSLKQLKAQLEEQKAKLDDQESVKTYYLIQARQSESEFQSLVQEAKQEQQAINNNIVALERELRERLEADGESPVQSTGRLIWPVTKNIITAYFHDQDYPFRHIFEHPAIDIRAAQGSPVYAADSGYVAKAADNGYGYSYIMLIHEDGISTVYGHVSKIYVQADTYVSQGDVIGLSGGAPGTLGAGRLTTGPHMHFEVRLNGIPVNPLDYLP